MSSNAHRPWTRDGWGLGGALLFLVGALLPIGFSLGYAAAYSVGWTGLMADGFTLAHWRAVLGTPVVWWSLGWSVYLAATVVVLTVMLALALALYLRRPLEYGALSYVIYFPLALPATVAAFLVFQLFAESGYMARIALALGVIEQASAFPSVVHDRYGIGILLAHLGLTVPFFTLLFVQIYNGERVDALKGTAFALGASRWQALRRITLPLLLRRSRTNIALLFIATLGSYEIPLLLGRQSPEMLSVLTLRKFQRFNLGDRPEAFIVALLYTAFVLSVLVYTFRYARPSEVTT